MVTVTVNFDSGGELVMMMGWLKIWVTQNTKNYSMWLTENVLLPQHNFRFWFAQLNKKSKGKGKFHYDLVQMQGFELMHCLAIGLEKLVLVYLNLIIVCLV